MLLPSQLAAEGFEIIGRSEHCALQGLWKQGRVLTYQGHAEFDDFINGETLKIFGSSIWSEQVLKKALKAVEGEDDALWAAGVMVRFFAEDISSEDVDARGVEGLNGGEIEVVHEEEVMARL